ncbi:BlaI/MecI/CopY family transcriptional regulator [Teredinibacter franksiae]|uniref:BlaI/MecI/CopY family transcriptional regulator n=1 Tax=Teredinibacter franksiae TaxID=2761453 RepID=UPI001627384E|nr:BlaI/MecI/CopY family transcriptional regulator [Teredinibacter franksiae]
MPNPTQAELEILNILWQSGESRVQEVHTHLSQQRDIGYTTTLKAMQVMAQKGLLDRRLDGRSHVYFPAIQERATKNKLLSRFIDNTFGGSSSQLVVQVLGNAKVSKEELDEIRAYLNQIEDE